ncbi:MAG: DUF116 domain-containing protein [Candidatus Methanospirareceae archaeon]|nr:MAG: polyprenyl synthetase [Methanophagales archaeon]HDN68585.1 DUF116 domain-containing protein [Methanomicrobia archaeon]
MIFETLGRAVVIFAVAFAVLLVLALLFCLFIFHTNRIIFPNFVLFATSLLYEPLRRLLSFFRVDPTLIDRVSVEIRNALNYHEFAATRVDERVLLLPQCLRSPECPAKLSAVDGLHCAGKEACGRCAIAELSAACEELGVKVFVSPGGTFAKRILLQSQPKAVVGVACYNNLAEGMLNAKLVGVPAQGVPLTTPGCVSTTVDIDKIIEKCKMQKETK